MQIQESSEWNEWQATALQERNTVENVYKWSCGSCNSIIGACSTFSKARCQSYFRKHRGRSQGRYKQFVRERWP
ncbi:hypothetical protein L1887_31702 [Cichorium endivia]|nr:hypothetical protein L1887_31702 [Cichorium endivia]